MLTNFEQRSRKLVPSKSGNGPNNFLTDLELNRGRDQSRFAGKRGCITCSKAGRDPGHDYKTCKHSIKWRKENEEKIRKREVEEAKSPNTKKKGKRRKKVKFQDPESSAAEDDEDQDAERRDRAAGVCVSYCYMASHFFYGKQTLLRISFSTGNIS